MHLSHRMRRVVTIAALAVVALTVAGMPAGASRTEKGATGKCPADSLCLFQKDDYKGQRVVISGFGVSNRIANQMDDEASSAKNRTGNGAILYELEDAGGEDVCIGLKEPDLDTIEFDDFTSSTKLPKNQILCIF